MTGKRNGRPSRWNLCARLSIKQKLRFVTMTVVIAALLLACAVFAVYDLVSLHIGLRKQLETMAQVIGTNSTAALTFGDQKAAEELLSGLRADPHLRAAYLYSAEGKLFAQYRQAKAGGSQIPAAEADGVRFSPDRLMVFHEIALDGRRVGTLCLESGLEEIQERLTRFGRIIAMVLLAASLAAYALSSRLQGVIAGPILDLARTAKRVSEERDYAIRAPRRNDDEVGDLVDGFNDMLGQIERHRDRLEEQVAERTAELRAAKDKAEAAVRELADEVRAKEQANAQLAEAQNRLMSLSRQAGMAEVATGVLHNVGNVLNSVNVAATVVANKVRDSRIKNVAAVAGMLEEHQSGLAEFLARDPKGQRLPGYLAKLGAHLQDERETMIRELEQLTRHVGHIKEIVSTQQSYAKVSGLTEPVDLAALAEDAVKIAALERSHIALDRQFEAVPPVAADKHAVLQILLNLLCNAKKAIEDSGKAERRVSLRIQRYEQDRVRVSVMDNGVGVPVENLTRIFAHGFTTRRDGHGFGLHSGANAAKQMGGRLIGESPGAGLGSTFILELPLRATKSEKEKHDYDTTA